MKVLLPPSQWALEWYSRGLLLSVTAIHTNGLLIRNWTRWGLRDRG